MAAVEEFAAGGGPVVGICNGFQVLTEAHLLPGALQKNRGLTFLCLTADLEVTSDRSVLTTGLTPGTRLRIPINHFEGNYTCDQRTLDELEAEGRVVLRYTDNPNGSVADIAGVANAAGNVVGLMPHPERAVHSWADSTDGRLLLSALLASGANSPAATIPPAGPAPAPAARVPG
jgi:phosphoribosylformylglycinamidine synthase